MTWVFPNSRIPFFSDSPSCRCGSESLGWLEACLLLSSVLLPSGQACLSVFPSFCAPSRLFVGFPCFTFPTGLIQEFRRYFDCTPIITSFGPHNRACAVSTSNSILEMGKLRLQKNEGNMLKITLPVPNRSGARTQVHLSLRPVIFPLGLSSLKESLGLRTWPGHQLGEARRA